MANTACTVKDISLTTVVNGSMYQGGIDREGMELANVQMVVGSGPDRRDYYCHNCKLTFDGSETFDVVKQHFGTFPID